MTQSRQPVAQTTASKLPPEILPQDIRENGNLLTGEEINRALAYFETEKSQVYLSKDRLALTRSMINAEGQQFIVYKGSKYFNLPKGACGTLKFAQSLDPNLPYAQQFVRLKTIHSNYTPEMINSNEAAAKSFAYFTELCENEYIQLQKVNLATANLGARVGKDGKYRYQFLMKNVQGADLFRIRHNIDFMLTPKQMITVGINILKAGKKLKQKKILHRDIKPANLICDLNDFTVTAIDYALAATPKWNTKKMKWELISGYVGTLAYAAPELINQLKVLFDQCQVYKDLHADILSIVNKAIDEKNYTINNAIDDMIVVIKTYQHAHEENQSQALQAFLDKLTEFRQQTNKEEFAYAVQFLFYSIQLEQNKDIFIYTQKTENFAFGETLEDWFFMSRLNRDLKNRFEDIFNSNKYKDVEGMATALLQAVDEDQHKEMNRINLQNSISYQHLRTKIIVASKVLSSTADFSTKLRNDLYYDEFQLDKLKDKLRKAISILKSAQPSERSLKKALGILKRLRNNYDTIVAKNPQAKFKSESRSFQGNFTGLLNVDWIDKNNINLICEYLIQFEHVADIILTTAKDKNDATEKAMQELMTLFYKNGLSVQNVVYGRTEVELLKAYANAVKYAKTPIEKIPLEIDLQTGQALAAKYTLLLISETIEFDENGFVNCVNPPFSFARVNDASQPSSVAVGSYESMNAIKVTTPRKYKAAKSVVEAEEVPNIIVMQEKLDEEAQIELVRERLMVNLPVVPKGINLSTSTFFSSSKPCSPRQSKVNSCLSSLHTDDSHATHRTLSPREPKRFGGLDCLELSSTNNTVRKKLQFDGTSAVPNSPSSTAPNSPRDFSQDSEPQNSDTNSNGTLSQQLKSRK